MANTTASSSTTKKVGGSKSVTIKKAADASAEVVAAATTVTVKATLAPEETAIAAAAALASATPAPEETAIAASVAEVDVMTSKLGELADKIASISIVMKDALAITKTLQKEYVRICKVHSAAVSSGRKKKASPSSTGPRKVALGSMSESMAQFLGRSVEDKVSRKDVVQGLNRYVKENKLQSPTDGRIILPDEKLNALLNIEEDVILNYFNMQRYINPHFSVIKGEDQTQQPLPVAVA
jgi:upstream activation factor subunit UAF30